MQTLILKSDNTKALAAIKTLAKVLDIESSMKEEKEDKDFIIQKGIKISKPKRRFDPQEMSGSLSDMNLEEPSVIRKKAWIRKKAY